MHAPHAKDLVSRLLARDIKLKVWVPESVYTAMTLLADEEHVSRAEWARYAFINHVFGRPVLEAAKAEAHRRYMEAPRFSLKRREPGEPVLPLGKSTVDSKLLVSRELHEALLSLAQRTGVPLGTYANHVLCWTAFGHGFYVGVNSAITAGYLLGDFEDTPSTSEAAQ